MDIYQHEYGDRTPYIYLIRWTALDKWYLGVRYARGCHPDEFWIKYHTSSKYVKKFIEDNGQPDLKMVIETFKTEKQARDFESLLIEEYDMVKDSRFLNRHNPKGKFYKVGPHSAETRQKLSVANTGKKHSEETLQRIRVAKENISAETRQKISYAMKNPSAETRQRMSDSQKGKTRSVEERKHLSELYKGKSPSNKGVPMSEEQKQKLRDSWARRRAAKLLQTTSLNSFFQ